MGMTLQRNSPTLVTQIGLVISCLPIFSPLHSISSHISHCNTTHSAFASETPLIPGWYLIQGKHNFSTLSPLSNTFHFIFVSDRSYSLISQEHAFSVRTLPSPTADLNRMIDVAITSSTLRSANNSSVFFHSDFSWLLRTPASIIRRCLSG